MGVPVHQDFRISIPTQLRSYTGGAAEVSVAVPGPEPRLADVFAALDAAYPGIRFRMVDEAGRMRPHVQVFVDRNVERNLDAVLPRGAAIMIVGALSGG
jgi:molybdopterin converting factor small subunit